MKEREQYQVVPFETVMSMGEVFAKSGYFTDAKEQAQAVVKMLAGQEMGVGPFASMSGIHIIQGKPEVGAHLLAAVSKRSGKYDYRVKQPIKADSVTLEFFEIGPEGRVSVGESTFTADDAKRAGTGNMNKFPRNMLFARALSNGVKWYCPDVSLSPLYSRGEIDEAANVEYIEGEVVEQDIPGVYTTPTGVQHLVGNPPYEQPKPQPDVRPWDAATLRANLLRRVEQIYASDNSHDGVDEYDEIPDSGHVGAMTGKLNGILGDDDRRHTFLRFVFGDPSSKELDRAQVQAVLDWIEGQAGQAIVVDEANRLVNKVAIADQATGTLFDEESNDVG